MLAAWMVYDTTRTTRIRDRRLASLYYFSVLAIVLYASWTIIRNKGYVEYEAPVGGLSIDVNLNSMVPLKNLSYCTDNNECIWWESSEILHTTTSKQTLITTYVEDFYEVARCNVSKEYGKKCFWDSIPEFTHSYYIAGVDLAELVIDHRAQAPVFLDESNEVRGSENARFSGSVLSMKGVLMNPKGVSPSINKFFHSKDYDKLSVIELLNAAGISSLDIPDKDNSTYRFDGVEVLVDISYNNLRCDGSWSCAFGTVPLEYRYRVFSLPSNNFVLQEIMGNNGTHQLRRIRHGILIHTTQAGKIARFSWPALLTNFTSAFWMLSIAVIIIDALAIYVIKEKTHYSKYKIREIDRVDPKSKTD